MIVVTILTTTPVTGGDGPFEHGRVKYTFAKLDTSAGRVLIGGPLFVFIDWSLPEMSGLEMCRRLRADPRMADAHLSLVLEQDSDEDRRRALAAGADDYVLGPVDRRRILDRVMVAFDVEAPRAAQIIAHGDLVIDLAALRARWRGQIIPLAENEFRLLRYLAEHPDEVHSRQQILAALGKDAAPLNERTADVWMKRLRTGLKEVGIGDALRTVRLHGYALELPGGKRRGTLRSERRREEERAKP